MLYSMDSVNYQLACILHGNYPKFSLYYVTTVCTLKVKYSMHGFDLKQVHTTVLYSLVVMCNLDRPMASLSNLQTGEDLHVIQR